MLNSIYDINTYLRDVTQKHTPTVNFDINKAVEGVTHHIHAWANGHSYDLQLSGSFAKDTAITGSTDIDVFISLDPSVSECNTLENVYTTLSTRMKNSGFTLREQNVSLGINHGVLKIDLVPGVRHSHLGNDHSLWKRKEQTWTKTNVVEHINHVTRSGRTFDIRMLKIWRKLRNLDFPSFYLELSVLEALSGKSYDNPSGNLSSIMHYLSDDFESRTIWDPSNTNNKVSDELSTAEKRSSVMLLNKLYLRLGHKQYGKKTQS